MTEEGQTEQRQGIRLEIERWPLGDTNERRPMYCVYLRSEKPVLEWSNCNWLRVGDLWDELTVSYINSLEAKAKGLEQALEKIENWPRYSAVAVQSDAATDAIAMSRMAREALAKYREAGG